MPYLEAKVYFDGSHYIAIPHTERPKRPRRKPVEDLVIVNGAQKKKENNKVTVQTKGAESHRESAPTYAAKNIDITEQRTLLNYTELDAAIAQKEKEESEHKKSLRVTTRKALFNELYAESMNLPSKDRKEKITEGLRPYFKTDIALNSFVDSNIFRKRRNLIVRRIRMTRKANLQAFNYFCTFTYDGKLHTEDAFKKKLKICFRNLCNRKGWKYMGVWERSPEKKRLHFHGLFYIPDGSMPGEIIEKRDYSFTTHQMQTTYQNTFFNKKFGRSDFEVIEDKSKLGAALAYLMKYIEKTGEKIVYCKGLYQYFMSDILDEDIVTQMDDKYENSKLLLYDDFICWDMGVKVGAISHETITKLRKCN